MTMPAPSTEIALLKSELLLAMAEMRGDTRLILQTLQQHDRRAEELADQIGTVRSRVEIVERQAASREELQSTHAAAAAEIQRIYTATQQEIRSVREGVDAELDARSRRSATWTGIMLSACAIVSSTGTAIVIAIVN